MPCIPANFCGKIEVINFSPLADSKWVIVEKTHREFLPQIDRMLFHNVMNNIIRILKDINSTKIIIILTLVPIIYLNTIYSPFHYDDFGVAIKSDLIEPDLSYFWEKTTGVFLHRLFLLYSFALNYHWGNGSVASYHIINIIFHILNSLLIYFILKNIIRHNLSFSEKIGPLDKKTQLKSFPFLSSLIFAVHPMNTETVTYISSRSSGMVTFFFLLSLYFFIHGTSLTYLTKKTNNKIAYLYYALSLLGFLIGLGTKETIVSLPAIIILYLYYFVNREKTLSKFIVKFKWHFIAVFIPAIAYLAYRKASTGSIFLAQTDDGIRLYGRYYYFITQLKISVFYYLKLFIFPINLNVYPMMTVSTSMFDLLIFMSFLTIVCLLTFAVIVSWRNQAFVKNKLISFAILWYFITLLPSSSFIPLNDLISEHRVYLPSIGCSILFGIVLTGFRSSLYGRIKFIPYKNLLVALVLLLFSLLTVQRNTVWKSGYSLWKDSALKTPNYAKPHLGLGREYNNRGLNDLAVEELKIAINLLPEGHSESHYNLGKVYSDLKQYKNAISEFILAIQYNKSNHTAIFSLGNAYSKIDQFDKAIKTFNKANRVFYSKYKKGYLEAVHNLGEVYGKMGELNKAIKQFEEVLKIDPGHILANENLAQGYKYLGDLKKAEFYLKKARYLKQRISN